MCIDLFSYASPYDIKPLVQTLQETYGVRVLTGEEAPKDPSFLSFYDITDFHNRFVSLNTNVHPILQYIQLHHESGHARTDHQLLTEPNNPHNVSAISISRKHSFDGPTIIDSSLPGAYQLRYRLDEVFVYAESSRLMRQIKDGTHRHGLSKDSLEAAATETKLKSQAFAAVSLRILKLAERELAKGIASQIIFWSISPHPYEVSGLFQGRLQVQGSLFEPAFQVDIPMHAQSTKDVYMSDALILVQTAIDRITPYSK